MPTPLKRRPNLSDISAIDAADVSRRLQDEADEETWILDAEMREATTGRQAIVYPERAD